ncbi:transposase [Streptomyces scabiei]|uniref:transposase n=1 Tax=Streptomyces scabiei TaxID=1930 RepID=UPI0039F68BA3
MVVQARPRAVLTSLIGRPRRNEEPDRSLWSGSSACPGCSFGCIHGRRSVHILERDAIALVDSSGRTVTAVARELGVSSESLRGWYRRAKADRGEGESGELTGERPASPPPPASS